MSVADLSTVEDPATVYVAIAAARHTQPNIGQEARVMLAAVAARIRAPRLTQRGRAGSSCCTQCWLRARCAWWRPTSTGRSFPMARGFRLAPAPHSRRARGLVCVWWV